MRFNLPRSARVHNGAIRKMRRVAALVVCLVALVVSAARAQGSCPPTRPNYRYAAYVYLTNPADSAWRDALGIAPRRLEDLRPLSDPGDALLCARIDSTLAPRRVFGFRIGRHVVVLKSATRGSLQIDGHDTTFFLFDSLGRELHIEEAGARSRAVPDPEQYLRPLDILVRESELGDLRDRPMRRDDVELRAWISGGMPGMEPRGVIIRRQNGKWRGWHAWVVSCRQVLAERAPTLKHCRQDEPRTSASFGIGTLDMEELQPTSAISDAWEVAVRNGIRSLPEVRYLRPMNDGSSFTFEVREGDEYRLSRSKIGRLTPFRGDDERRTKAIIETLFKLPRKQSR